MADLTVGQARQHLAQSRNGAQALLQSLEALNPSGVVVDLRVGIGPTIPIPMGKCALPEESYLTVSDYVAAMRGIVTWIDDLILCLDVPDDRPFSEGPRT